MAGDLLSGGRGQLDDHDRDYALQRLAAVSPSARSAALLVDMRDLAQVLAHMHGQAPLDLTGKPDPDLQ
jgi:hypothetical protein